MKKNTNHHITEFLKYYINLPFPEYAILLNGRWGSGKTFFIDDFIEKHENKDKKFEFVKISLFGMNTTSEIDEELFQQLHPFLGSKYIKLVTNITKGALKLGVNLDWDEDKQSDGRVSIDLKDFKIFDSKDGKNKTDIIFVLDDLERTDIDISKVLGYINSLVEYSKQKVIVLANEEQLLELNEKKIYKEFKEKVIGKTFQVKQDFDAAFDSFLELAKNAKATLVKNQKNIFEVFKVAGYNNLRHIRQSILDFEHLFDNIEEKYRIHPQLMKDFVGEFFIFSIEAKTGKSINKEYEQYMNAIINKDDEDKGNIFNKYSFLDNNQILQSEEWDSFFSQGTIQKKFLSIAFAKSQYFIDETKEDWVKLYHFGLLEEDEFKEVLKVVKEKFINNEYCDKTTLLHVAGLLLFLSKNSLYDLSLEEVKKQIKQVIENCSNSENWKQKQYEIDFHNGTGLGFYDIKSKDFQEIQDYLIKKNQEAISHNLPSIAKEILGILKLKKDDIYELLTDKLFDQKHTPTLSELPVFSHLDAKEFLNVFLELKNKEIGTVMDIMKQRYNYYHDNMADDLQFWKNFNKLLENELDKYNATVKGYWIKHTIKLIDESIIKIIETRKKLHELYENHTKHTEKAK